MKKYNGEIISEYRAEYNKVYSKLGKAWFIFRQTNDYKPHIYMIFENGWALRLQNNVYDAKTFAHALTSGGRRASTLDGKHFVYMKKRLYLEHFYKHVDYTLNKLFPQAYRHMLDKVMRDINTYFEPNYAYFLDLIGQFFPIDLTIQRQWLWFNKFCDLVNRPPILWDYVPTEDLTRYVFSGKTKNQKPPSERIPYDEFLKAIEHLTNEDVMELCSMYDYNFKQKFPSLMPDVRRLLYRLTHHHQTKGLNIMDE